MIQYMSPSGEIWNINDPIFWQLIAVITVI